MRHKHNSFKWDLGMRSLYSEWKKLFTTRYLKEDLLSGITVACTAIPFSLAIALASGVEPATGLVTAIIAGTIGAVFGGTTLGVSGPAAALSILVASAVQAYGFQGVLAIGLTCGVLQLLSGVFRIGKFIRFIPMPVIAGFTAGIGAIILADQLPKALGIPLPNEPDVLKVFGHVHTHMDLISLNSIALCFSTLAIILASSKAFPKLPTPMFAVVLTSVVSLYLGSSGGEIARIGNIVNALPSPGFPVFPTNDIATLLLTSLMVYYLASLETLQASSSVDKVSKENPHDTDQEFIGQGLGNIVSAFLGGIPAAGGTVRTSLNYQSGAKTRRAAFFHSLVILGSIFFLAPIMGQIPIAVLAGVLFSIAIKMINPRIFLHLLKVSPADALVYTITFITMISIDLILGVKAGLAAALIIAAIKLGKNQATLHSSFDQGIHRISISGPLTFMSSAKIEMLQWRSETITSKGHGPQSLVVEMSGVSEIDPSSAEQILAILKGLQTKGVQVVLQGLTQKCQEKLLAFDESRSIKETFAVTEKEVHDLLLKGSVTTDHDAPRAIHRLVFGVNRFQHELREKYEPLFKRLSNGQDPHTLFITCSDSRIDPNLITCTEPGELFIVRNVGNIVPRFQSDDTPAEGAALEFAIQVLGVKEVVVCGHSGCGAMKATVPGGMPTGMPSLKKWMNDTVKTIRHLPANASIEDRAKLNVQHQLEQVKSYPIVQTKVASGELQLHGWYFDVGNGKLECWDEKTNSFYQVAGPSPKKTGIAKVAG